MTKNKQIAALNEAGQSVWYDNISRDVLRSGELAQLVAAGVSGLTSNPSIFQNAITKSDEYDEELSSLAGQSADVESACEELMLGDVSSAAELLAPVYHQSRGADGYVSVEVSPFIAHDAEKTVAEARRLNEKLGHSNLMIKVPATQEGIPAIQRLLEQGLNINVTLIFSVEVYRQVIEAYLAALESRVKRGEDVSQIASVASFFVSRVDAICEKNFDRLLAEGNVLADDRQLFLGKAGIANSKMAYECYQQAFGSERFLKLKARGARVQRPLWASTSTKNPDFDPTLYVDALAGPDTVNTLPPNTLKLLMEKDGVECGLLSGMEQARQTLQALASLGIELEVLLEELQRAGVKSFSDAYQGLLEAVQQKLNSLR